MFSSIPTQRPVTPLLDTIASPADIRLLHRSQLIPLAEQLRSFLLYTVGQSGGHFGAGLGVIELTVALHFVFQTPRDKLVWDVGHQTYPHKILCGRREHMQKIRRADGPAPFPHRGESEYDAFGTGHSSTSISAALGMERAAFLQKNPRKHVAIIGDGAMTAGMAFEALNHAGELHSNLLVILNDNAMSISNNVGALSSFFAKFIAGKNYMGIKQLLKDGFKDISPIHTLMHQTEEGLKHMFLPPSSFFETLGFNYTGIVDGHDLFGLTDVLESLKELEGPQLLHIKTQKGKGYAPAELDPIAYHALSKIEALKTKEEDKQSPKRKAKSPTYSQVFGNWICKTAQQDTRLVAITPAMREGSGLTEFSKKFPERYFDVGIAEQHAVTLAAGLACEGFKPVVAIYSTFLQRGYDQLIHDVCLQNLPVLFALDRAGLVGEDGPTHNGAYDLSYLSCIPNMTIMTPSDESMTYRMLTTAHAMETPVAVRYPRGMATGIPFANDTAPVTGGAIVRSGGGKKEQASGLSGIAILAFGTLLQDIIALADTYDWTLADMRFVKPLDKNLINQLLENHTRFVTLEENVITGGAGSEVACYLMEIHAQVELLILGIDDRFIPHGSREEMLSAAALDANSIEKKILARWASGS